MNNRLHRADFPTMSHVASADFTSFVSTPTNPISLPKPTVGLSGSYLKADHKYFCIWACTYRIPYFIIIIIFLVRCLNPFQQMLHQLAKYRLINILTYFCKNRISENFNHEYPFICSFLYFLHFKINKIQHWKTKY